MIGRVDVADRALIDLEIRAPGSMSFRKFTAWIDTAFTGDLVLPRSMIELLGLPQSSSISAGLADGKQVVLETFSCVVDWFGEARQIEAVESESKLALLGTGLLRGHKLEIDYVKQTLSVN